ncbi:MAG: hypothetical protein ACO1N0_14045 [Fluviicola sp.]
MKIHLLTFILLLLFVSSCQKNDDLLIGVRSVSFQAASTENEYFTPLPVSAADSITTDHFVLQVNWDIERLNDAGYDPVETTVINTNPVDSIKIWSDQTVAGRSPGSSLNTLFEQYYSSYVAAKPLKEDGGLIYFSAHDTFDEPLRKISFLNPNTWIAPGTYNFHFRCVFRNGGVQENTIPHVVLK